MKTKQTLPFLQGMIHFSLGMGLTAGLFLARRIPELSLPLCVAALYLVALFCLIYTRPSTGFFEMARNMHKPDDLALEFAAGNIILALRLCGLPPIACS